MAKNRDPVPKPAESEETDDELVSDSQSDSESEQETQPPPKATIPPPAVSNDSDSVADSDSDTDSSESDLPPKKSDPPKSKPAPSSSSAVKRPPLKTTEAQDSKKAKKAEPSLKKDSDDVSKKLFQRVFSDEDEIVLLEGMVDFISKKKSDPIVKVDEFLDFVKKLKLFSFDVTRTQLVNKMKRLKVKYENNVGKVKDGNHKKLKKHEKEAFALSESIWGGGGGSSAGVGNEGATENGGVVKKNKNATGRVSDEVEDKEVVAEESGDKKSKSVGGGSSTGVSGVTGVDSVVEKKVMSEDIKNVDSVKKKELEKKRSNIEVVELELFAMRCEYLAEKARLMAAAKKA